MQQGKKSASMTWKFFLQNSQTEQLNGTIKMAIANVLARVLGSYKNSELQKHILSGRKLEI